MYEWLKKYVFLTAQKLIEKDSYHVSIRIVKVLPAKNATLSIEFSLCLSRACLGKMVHFIYKWRKSGAFLYRGP